MTDHVSQFDLFRRNDCSVMQGQLESLLWWRVCIGFSVRYCELKPFCPYTHTHVNTAVHYTLIDSHHMSKQSNTISEASLQVVFLSFTHTHTQQQDRAAATGVKRKASGINVCCGNVCSQVQGPSCAAGTTLSESQRWAHRK